MHDFIWDNKDVWQLVFFLLLSIGKSNIKPVYHIILAYAFFCYVYLFIHFVNVFKADSIKISYVLM